MSKDNPNPYFGATFAERKAARLAAEKGEKPKPAEKAVDAEDKGVEDKAVTASETKKRTTRKKS